MNKLLDKNIIQFLFLISCIITGLFIDLNTMIFLIIFYFLGNVILRLTSNSILSIESRVYNILFIFGYFYLFTAYVYMQIYNYDFLLIIDTNETFLPSVKNYLNAGNIIISFKQIWEGYSLFDRSIPGYYSILIIFAYISDFIGSHFYVSIQIGTLFLSSYIGVLIYKILINH